MNIIECLVFINPTAEDQRGKEVEEEEEEGKEQKMSEEKQDEKEERSGMRGTGGKMQDVVAKIYKKYAISIAMSKLNN